VLAVVAAACAIVAVAYPSDPWARAITVEDGNGRFFDPAAMTVRIDDRLVVVRAPAGYAITGWGTSDVEEVAIELRSDDDAITLRFSAGRGPASPRPLLDGRGLRWELVPGATVSARSGRAPVETLQALLDDLEISR
jgi:hypothetical protein